MADDFTTIAGIDAIIADTGAYDQTGSSEDAWRRIRAIRQKIHLTPQSSGRDGMQITFAIQVLKDEEQQVLAWINANSTPTDAQRLNNPSVTHADFSTFREYQ